MSALAVFPTPTDGGSVEQRLEVVCRMLADCTAVDDAKLLADHAAAMHAYARRARLSREAANYAAEVKLRAERRAGQLLPSAIQRGGNAKAHDVTLGDLGIGRMQSQRWQQLATIPDPVFEDYLARYRRGQGELASKGLYDLARQYKPATADKSESAPPRNQRADIGPLPGIAPYYADAAAGIYLYHGDARELAPLVVADTLITDPPYGVALGTSKTTTGLFKNGRAGYAEYTDTLEEWRALVPPLLAPLVTGYRRAAVFTGPHLWAQEPAVAIGGIFCPAAMGRHAWGFKTFLPILFYGTDPRQEEGRGCHPIVLHSNATADKNGHPCPKPIEWMRWLVERASRATDVILDPFAGSGQTLRAAKDCGRACIGIEIDERYCEIAAGVLAQAVLPFAAPEQAQVEAAPLFA